MTLLNISHRLSSLLQLGVLAVVILTLVSQIATWSLSIATSVPAVTSTHKVAEADGGTAEIRVPGAHVALKGLEASPPPAALPAESRNGSKVAVRIGDRLTVALFEQLISDEEQKWASKQRGQRNSPGFRQRAEFSGEFEVKHDGLITIPMLGTLAVVERTLDQVEKDIGTAFVHVLGRPALVSVTVQDQPIFLLGPVRNPGTYKYSHGLTVLHLIALGGGFDRSAIDLNHMLDALGGVERRQKAKLVLARLLTRQAVLLAEKVGGQPEAQTRLIELVGGDVARKSLEVEAAARQHVLAGRHSQNKALDSAEASTRAELSDLKARRGHVETRIKLLTDRVAALAHLGDKVSRATLTTADAELSGAKERFSEALAAERQAEVRISRIVQERTQAVAQAEADVAAELQSIEAQIAEAEQTLSSQARTMEFLSAATSAAQANGDSQVHYEIVRISSGKSNTIAANGTDLVQPGDLVRVTIARPQPEASAPTR